MRASLKYSFVLLMIFFSESCAISALITPTSGSRTVGVNIINESGGGDSATGPLSGRWDASIGITRPISREGIVRGSMTCYAEQHSNITSQSIVDNGVVRMSMVQGEGVTVTGIAQSRINLRFTVDQATPFSLQIFSPSTLPFSGDAFVGLFRDSGGSSISGVDTVLPGPAIGMLEPGAYRIETTMRIFATLPRGGPGEFFYAWSFNIPSPAHAAPLAIMLALLHRRRR